MAVNLSTTYVGISLKNPIVIGGGPNTATPKICEKAAKAGWAGVVLKLNAADDVIERIFPDRQTVYKVPRPAYKIVDGRGLNKWRPVIPKVRGRREPGKKAGTVEPKDYQLVYWNQNVVSPQYTLYSAIGTFYNGDEKYLQYIDKTKELVEPYDCKVIANVTAYTEKGWEQQVNLVNKSKADAVEVVIACPAYGCFDHRTQRVRRFQFLDIFPEIIENATKFYVERSNKPVSVKLPPYYMNPLAPVQGAVRGGARAIQFGDCPTVTSPVPPVIVDPDTLEVGLFPGAPYQGSLTQCSAVPFICGAISQFRLKGIEIDIAGCGGVRHYWDVIRILLSGASSVQVVTAVLVEGVDIAQDYLAGIEAWMEEKGYKSIRDFQGLIATEERLKIDPQKFVTEVAQAAGGPTPSLRVVVNEKRCINCGWCESACPEMAIEIKDKLPIIDEGTCEVCGLCVSLCPMEALFIEAKASANI
jgi:dihydroorotate dehydrogenase/Pyruvate/2-oxoacid:ferredoxin oxidoreductase delta subunit